MSEKTLIGSGARRSPVSAFAEFCEMHKAFHLKADLISVLEVQHKCQCYHTAPRNLHELQEQGTFCDTGD